jgi:hypothetical protein
MLRLFLRLKWSASYSAFVLALKIWLTYKVMLALELFQPYRRLLAQRVDVGILGIDN